jgi:DNA polymerase III sliding clamp (beta) subunit (PCNA family)
MNQTQEKVITSARVEAKSFHALLAGALTHASKDESLRALNGVYLWREDSKVKAMSTDRFRLIEGEIEGEGEGEGESSPIRLAYDDAKALTASLSKVKGYGKVELTLAGDLVSAVVGGSTLTYTAHADTPPPYSHLFPTENMYPAHMPHASFNPSFFADYGKIVGKKGQVVIKQYKENHAYEIEIVGDLEGVSWKALLMPMRKI